MLLVKWHKHIFCVSMGRIKSTDWTTGRALRLEKCCHGGSSVNLMHDFMEVWETDSSKRKVSVMKRKEKKISLQIWLFEYTFNGPWHILISTLLIFWSEHISSPRRSGCLLSGLVCTPRPCGLHTNRDINIMVLNDRLKVLEEIPWP